MSKRCPKCHGQYDDIYRFCGDCGISLVSATQLNDGKSIFYKMFHLDEWFPSDYEKAEAYVKLLYMSLAITLFGFGINVLDNLTSINPMLYNNMLFSCLILLSLPILLILVSLDLYFVYVNIYIAYKSGIIKFILKIILGILVGGLIYMTIISISAPLATILLIYSAYSNRERMKKLSQYNRFLKYPLMIILTLIVAGVILLFVMGIGAIGAIGNYSSAIVGGSILISGILALFIIVFSVFAPTIYMVKFIRSEVASGTGFYKTILLSYSVPIMWLLCFIACYSMLSHAGIGSDLIVDAGLDTPDVSSEYLDNSTIDTVPNTDLHTMMHNNMVTNTNTFDNNIPQLFDSTASTISPVVTNVSTPIQPVSGIEDIIPPVSVVPVNHDIVLKDFFGIDQLHITANSHGGLSIFDGQNQMIGLASTNHDGIDINFLNGEHHRITTGGDMFDEKALFSGSIHHHADGSITITDKMQQIVRTVDAQGNIYDEKHLLIGSIKV